MESNLIEIKLMDKKIKLTKREAVQLGLTGDEVVFFKRFHGEISMIIHQK